MLIPGMDPIYSGSIIISDGKMFRFAHMAGIYIDRATWLLEFPCGHIFRGTLRTLHEVVPQLNLNRSWDIFMGTRGRRTVPVYIFTSDHRTYIRGEYNEHTRQFAFE